ncbi:MAG: MGMT family protein [Candidatus Moeniiplasma glomeromycotorum]|nr:MGMT family protein [Candidatus Moeniiplasma glomeromycotorum]MCE8167335.1 MGMT family protein [Candidatus Moeniiplasma glomeromycotorum]MCE8168652.1 MGMT family protein [Candidatus Moeniiplasma glomeromycotorum]
MSQKVYQLCSQIPPGKVSTYKIIAQFAYGSPNYARRVGTLLSHCPDCELAAGKQNYDCPQIHCYRIIKSDFHLGGFLGETSQEQIKIKREKLAREGVFFDEKGYLLKDLRNKIIFKDFS